MRQSRFFLYAFLGAVLGTAACSSEQTAPVALKVQPTFSLLGNVSALLLQCSPQTAVSRTQEIGPGGGELWVGAHYLVVPKNALKQKVLIRGEIVSGNINSVRFYPEGLQFGAGTKLYLSYKNCSGLGMLLPKRIAYLDEQLNLLELLTSLDLKSDKMVIGDLRHFSRYAVAY